MTDGSCGVSMKTTAREAVFHTGRELVLMDGRRNTELTDSCSELSELVGLEEAKRMIRRIVDFYRVQKLRQDRYPGIASPVLQLIFCGNPGTGKRTVAGLLGKILQEEGIIGSGNLYDVGQAELLGLTSGESARRIRDYFEKARGSVLYIDHLQSLTELSDHSGSDVIHALLREMDNCHPETVVILADNHKRLDELDQWYPELCGRMAFWVRFPDYSVDELYEILCKMAAKEGYKLKEDARDGFFQRIMWKDTRKGNAKLIRNLLDHAKLNQAARILRLPERKRDQEMMTLRGVDFERM